MFHDCKIELKDVKVVRIGEDHCFVCCYLYYGTFLCVFSRSHSGREEAFGKARDGNATLIRGFRSKYL